eukprot:330602-Pelagomonas_calceolata.AAC.1
MSWSRSHQASPAGSTHVPASALVDAPAALVDAPAALVDAPLVVAAAMLHCAVLGVKPFGFFSEAVQDWAQGSHSCLTLTSVERS